MKNQKDNKTDSNKMKVSSNNQSERRSRSLELYDKYDEDGATATITAYTQGDSRRC